MTVKELQNKLRQEKFDVKNARVYVQIENECFEVENVNIYDGEVHITVGEPAEEVRIIEKSWNIYH
jgi:hypothetical protein